MTKDEIIAMAEEADLWCHSDSRMNAITAFAALVAAKERARIADWVEPQRSGVPATGAEFANAIRKMGP